MQGKGIIAAVVAVAVIVLSIAGFWFLPEDEPSRTAVKRPETPKTATSPGTTAPRTPSVSAPSHAVPPAPPATASKTPPPATEAAGSAPSVKEKPADKAAEPSPQKAEKPAAEEAVKTAVETGRKAVQDGVKTVEKKADSAVTAGAPDTQPSTQASSSASDKKAAPEPEKKVAVLTPQTPPVHTAQPAPQSAPPMKRPSFDVVRISQQCTAVIAGRAEANAEVTVWDGEQPLGQVNADANGEWVLLVSQAMRSGSRQLRLIAIGADGKPVESESVVVIAVPDCSAPPKQEKEPVIAVMTPKEGGASTVLQAPPPEDKTDEPKGLALKSVDYDEKGEVVLSGKAEPGKSVQAYVDNKPVGAAKADDEGRWQVKPEEAIEPGVHKLRVDQVEQGGKVAARIELPFSRASAAQITLEPGHVIVQPGNSLWRIARRTYGHGLRYSVIYQANEDQIRNPDLIYPGQIFSLPRVN